MFQTVFGRAGTAAPRRRALKIAVIAAATASVVTLSACSGGGGSTSNSGSAKPSGNPTKGSITWWASPITTSGTDPRTVLIDDFEKAYPNIKVKLVSAPNDTDTNRATLTTQISGGGGPDVYMGDVIWPAQFADHQLALDLSKYLPKSYFKTFASGLTEGASYKGDVYGAPFFEDQGFLFYRKDLLQQNNLPVPKTWEQLESDAKMIQSKGQAKYGYVFQGADYEGATCNYAEFLADAGGKVLNKNASAGELNSSAALKALKFEQSLVTSGVSPTSSSTFQETQAMNAFSSGQAVFLRNWDYAYSTSQASGSAVIGKVGVAPMPNFEGKSTPGYSNIGGWNLYVNPHSKNVAADLTFLKWMTAKEAQTTLATQFSEIPTVQSVREASDVKSANPVLAIISQTKLIARPSNSPQYPQISQAIYDNVNAVLAGSETPTAALKKANSSINTAVKGGGL